MHIPTTLKHKPVLVAEDYGRIDGRSIPWVNCLIISVVTFLGLVIFKGRDLRSEIAKRLHL